MHARDKPCYCDSWSCLDRAVGAEPCIEKRRLGERLERLVGAVAAWPLFSPFAWQVVQLTKSGQSIGDLDFDCIVPERLALISVLDTLATLRLFRGDGLHERACGQGQLTSHVDKDFALSPLFPQVLSI